MRRDRVPLEYKRFIGHFFEGGSADISYLYGDEEGGYILGVLKQGVFIPTHFAPKILRGGFRLIDQLGYDYGTPTIMATTLDLMKTIIKMPQ